ncbi:MAG: haloacid dehalogenase [Armatimonadetes bacterium]|nr:haloacid dehalogenase [Armatimonadota bacterium]
MTLGLEPIAERARSALERRSAARDEALVLSREVIRTCANTIRAVHRGELERAAEMLGRARESLDRMRATLAPFPEVYTAGYVHDCQKEYAEACAFLAVVAEQSLPSPEELVVEFPAYLNGLAETVGEIRRHTLDLMRQGDLARAEALLAAMDEIYDVLVTIDFPDALTGGLRRSTDAARGIIEKTRGELTTALRQEELRFAIQEALTAYQVGARGGGAAAP